MTQESPLTPSAPAAAPAAAPTRAAAAKRKPPRPVHPLLQKLFEFYPRLFGARFLPLKRGVFEDLVAAHPADLPAAELKVALGMHTRSNRYIEAVASGLPRHDLQASPVEAVAPEHVHHAILELYKRRRDKAPEQSREKAVQQLAAAVEASGMTREAYRERFSSPDDNLQALLEEGLSLVAQKNARREALQRAFQASGKTVSEFAQMYGLDVAEAQKLLG